MIGEVGVVVRLDSGLKLILLVIFYWSVFICRIRMSKVDYRRYG